MADFGATCRRVFTTYRLYPDGHDRHREIEGAAFERLSEAMAQQEVERYTFWAPGQAPSYFVGYDQLLETRAKAERMLGEHFDRKKFNDFVLAQGLLPVELLDKIVMNEFVPQQLAAK